MRYKMNSIQDGPSSSGATGRIHTVQPLRDLESNWAVDLAKELEEYLLKICSGEIKGGDGDDSNLSVNFAEAALLLQGSIQVYSRKVEYLYSLVLHALEFISQKSQQVQSENALVSPEESSTAAVVDEENDPFWGFDEIQVEVKNSLDEAAYRDLPSNYFVKPPANLVVLEGDCLDATGDIGELESYLLSTCDLYQDFILLDSCDAVAVDSFLENDSKTGGGQNGVKGSSLASKSRKSFLSPGIHSGGTGRKLSIGKSPDKNHNRASSAVQAVEFNDCNIASHPPSCNNFEMNDQRFEMDNDYSEPRDFHDSDDEGDDPWKPLNPHEPGNLKVKPFKRVKTQRRVGVSATKLMRMEAEFPLARLHGTIDPELNEIWEAKLVNSERQQESQSPHLYETLRESLIHGGHGNFDAFCGPNGDNKDDGDDCWDHDFGMPGSGDMDEDENLHPGKHDDGNVNFGNEAHEQDYPCSQANLEDLCRSHLDALLSSIAETEKQSELAARVSTWKQRIEQDLEEQESRPPFDIHEYGERVLEKLSMDAESENAMSFADIVRGQEKHNVARTFSALLQLVNNGDVGLERTIINGEFTCYTAKNPFRVRLLRRDKRRVEMKFQLSRKRAKSLAFIKCENKKPGKENLNPRLASSSQSNCKIAMKMGKTTPNGKRRRRSGIVGAVDLNS